MKGHQKLVGWLVLLLALAILVGCGGSKDPASTAPAAQGALDEGAVAGADVVAASAVVVPRQEAVLSVRASGRVTAILVKEGDAVTEGQELVRVESRDLEQVVLEAEARLKSAQAGLAKARAGARPEELASAEATVTVAKVGVQNAEGAVKVSEGNLASVQADLKAAEGAIEVAKGNLAAAQATQSGAQASFEKLLAGPTASDIQIAEKQLEQAQNELYALQSQRDAMRNVGEGQIAAAEAQVAIVQLQLEQLRAGAQREDVTIARAQVLQAQAGVQTAAGQLTQAEARLIQAQAGVRIAEAQLEQSKIQVLSASAQLAQAQAQLDLVRAGSRAEDIAAAEANVAQVEAALVSARNTVDDAVLRAPFAGTVGELLVEPGELVSPQTPAVRLGDLTQLWVKTEDLSEVDVTLVREGQAAVVTVDALPNSAIAATVARVAPYAVERRGDKVYDVWLDLALPQDAGLLWGMSAFVEIKLR